ncbi:YdcF family protein [bacterium]|nr:MAG: YdcF family protein [bacterium]
MKSRTKLFLKFLLGVVIISVFLWLNLVYRIYKQSTINETQQADAIVVLGASQWNGQPSPVLQSRLDHALALYKLNLSDHFILTGGIGENNVMSESLAGKNYLIQQGIIEENIFIEEKSRTTWQNLKEVVNILEQHNFNSVILVSDGFHMFRLQRMAEDLEIINYISPVEKEVIKQNKLTNFKYIIRESVVYVLYRLFKI